MIALSNFS